MVEWYPSPARDWVSLERDSYGPPLKLRPLPTGVHRYALSFMQAMPSYSISNNLPDDWFVISCRRFRPHSNMLWSDIGLWMTLASAITIPRSRSERLYSTDDDCRQSRNEGGHDYVECGASPIGDAQ